MVVRFLLLFLVIQQSSPSPALRVFETNPSTTESTEIMNMETMPKIEREKRSLVLMELYLNTIFNQLEKNQSKKSKEKIRNVRYRFGIFPRMNAPKFESSDY